MLPTNFLSKNQNNMSDILYHSTNADLLFEGINNSMPRSPAYFTSDINIAKKNILDYHPSKVGPTRILKYKAKKYPLLYNIDENDIDKKDIKKFFNDRRLPYDEMRNNDYKWGDITEDSILNIFGKKLAPVVMSYFQGYDGLIENNLIVIFYPEKFLSIEKIEDEDDLYKALYALLTELSYNKTIYDFVLEAAINTYNVDKKQIKYLLMINASKFNKEIPNIQIIQKLLN
jgi:hypothetical protein